MQTLKSTLPPLDALVAFEASARLGSFTRAARELNVTQAAISRQVRNLEDDLGVRLFDRSHRAISLTADGRHFQHSVVSALSLIGSASSELRDRQADMRLHVATDQSVAALWLMPRLKAFRAAHPGINLRCTVSDREADCLADGVDYAIIHGAGSWRGFDSELLFAEEVFPVCSPDYAKSVGPLQSPADLPGQTLLELDDDHWNWLNWRMWLSARGVDLPVAHRSLQINHYPLLIQAACEGQGVALGWRVLVDDLLNDGALVAPVRASMKTGFGYHLVWPHNLPAAPPTEAFRAWIRGGVL